MHLTSPNSAILSAVIFNALIIIAVDSARAARREVPRARCAASLLRRNLTIYGLGGIAVPFAGIKLIDMALATLRLV